MMNKSEENHLLFHPGIDNFTQLAITSLIENVMRGRQKIIFTSEFIMRDECICDSLECGEIWICVSKNKLEFTNCFSLNDDVDVVFNKLKFLSKGLGLFCWSCYLEGVLKRKDKQIIRMLKDHNITEAAYKLKINKKTLYSRVSVLHRKLGFSHGRDFYLWCAKVT